MVAKDGILTSGTLMDVWMTDNEHGQSIAVVWDRGVWAFKRAWNPDNASMTRGWHYFPDWEYPLREPTSVYEIAMMARLANK